MKACALVCFVSLLAVCQAAQLQVSPVTRVVNLLRALSAQIEKEGKTEEDLFESFVCWGKSVIAQKTDSNTAANSRKDSLETYVADLDAGKVELTTERVDLEKEIKELTADLDQAKAMRKKEKKDFDGAKDEMTKAIKAMSSAIKVLNEATKGNKKGMLLEYKAELNSGMEAVAAESANLNAAADLGERYLTKADAMFLRRVLTGEVPKRDHKMLNKKATFKMAYKTRSGKIQALLAKLKGQFDANLKDAEKKEKESKGAFENLAKAKGDLLKKTEKAYSSMEGEGGARGVAKQTAQDEVKALKKQVSNDEKFIKQTEKALADKKKEWGERSKLREGELEAISKAINILYNDDSRDLFKKSHSSQEGLFFLQMESASAIAASAVSELKATARRSGDSRLSALAGLVAMAPSVKGKFKSVVTAIDKMIATLKSDEKKDLETKQSCEKDRMSNTRKALLAGNDIDDKTDAIRKLESEIKDLEEEIANLLAEKKKVKEELEKADELRQEENAAWKVTNRDDTEAAKVVKDASDVLKKFYSTAFNFVQTASKAPEVVEGEAPPPPPSTWGSDYGGKQGEQTGIMAILEMVRADILKDLEKAKDEEANSLKEFKEMEKESNEQMKDLQKEADKQTGTKGKKETERTDTIKQRKTKHGEWAALMKTMKDIDPDCEYYAVNYKMRVKNRAIEVDGLNKAKAILQGGSFKKLL